MSESAQTSDQTATSNQAAVAEDAAIHVDVWFDVRCPWCFIGKRRFERAVDLFHETHPEVPVTVQHHSFELAPGIPERFDGGEAEYLLQYEGVPLEQSRKMLPALQELAASEGMNLRFDDLKEVNTRRAHRVFQYGQKQGVGEEILERFFTAYFSELADMADIETLVTLAAEVGLDSEEHRAAIREAAAPSDGEGVADGTSEAKNMGEGDPAGESDWDGLVSADHVRGEMLGAAGVPFSLFNAKYRVAGAQSAEILADAMRRLVKLEFANEESQP